LFNWYVFEKSISQLIECNNTKQTHATNEQNTQNIQYTISIGGS